MTQQRRALDMGTLTTRDIVERILLEFKREDLQIAIPAIVTDTSKYESEQCINVKPVVDDVYPDGITIPAIEITNVFVKLQEGGGFKIKLPISVGDKCTLHWSHRDVSAYMNTSGDESVTSYINMIGKSGDCWATHGFGTRGNHQSPSLTDLIIEGENTKITIKPSGEITTETNGKVTLKTPEYFVDTPTTTFTGNVQINGDSNVDGKTTCPTIEASNSLKIAGAEVKQHTHNNQVPPLA